MIMYGFILIRVEHNHVQTTASEEAYAITLMAANVTKIELGGETRAHDVISCLRDSDLASGGEQCCVVLQHCRLMDIT